MALPLQVQFTNTPQDLQEKAKIEYLHLPLSKSEVFFAPILESRKLTSEGNVTTIYELTLSKKEVNCDYLPGDTIGIFAPNDDQSVDRLLIRLGLETLSSQRYDLTISPENTKKNYTIPKHLPKSGILRNIFINHVDIRSPPKKLFLKSLIEYTKNQDEKEKLQHICTPKGSNEYSELINGSGRTFPEFLDTFPSCTPSVELLLEHLPPLQPRAYSLISSPLEDRLQILFSVTEIKDGIKGICTGWLEKLITTNACDIKIPFYFRKSHNFRLPEDDSVPIIMIASGTGVAPFKGFLQHRHRSLEKFLNDEVKYGKSWLFFGCRRIRNDFVYREDFQNYLREGVLSRLHVGFSREFRNTVYVQHKVEEYGAEIIGQIIDNGAIIYVCGNPKTMMPEVKSTIRNVLVRFGHLSNDEADKYLENMIKTGRYRTDVWV